MCLVDLRMASNTQAFKVLFSIVRFIAINVVYLYKSNIKIINFGVTNFTGELRYFLIFAFPYNHNQKQVAQSSR